MTERLMLNDGWVFSPGWSEDMIDKPMRIGQKVRIPHTVRELPFHYFKDDAFQGTCAYQYQLEVPMEWRDGRVLLTFEGAAHHARVYVNGSHAGSHYNGYTAFTLDISSLVVFGTDNLISLSLGCRFDPALAMEPCACAYGGLIRDVFIDVKNPVYMERVFYRPSLQDPPKTRGMSLKRLSETQLTGVVDTRVMLSQEGIRKASQRRLYVCQFLNGKQISNQPLPPDGKTTTLAGKVHIWDTAHPFLYEIRTEVRLDGETVDSHIDRIGFRNAQWKKNGFYLNGRPLRLRGLDRYQSYPYVGYAMPKSIQYNDAAILKNELGCNVVRTADGPPARAFLEGCDRVGLLAVVVMPVVASKNTWDDTQRIFSEMLEEYNNHPSVIIWEAAVSNDVGIAFYNKWLDYSHRLDPSRPLAGHCIKGSNEPWGDVCVFEGEFKDDEAIEVPSDNNDKNRPYLLSGYGGYRCGVRMSDPWEKKRDQMIYHASVMNSVFSEDEVAGAFGSSMCDYVGANDSGDIDGICYFGVMDAFRNPKPSAYLYAAQSGRASFLEVISDMHPPKGANRLYGDCYIISTSNRVEMWADGRLIADYSSKSSAFSELRNGPIRIDEYVTADIIAEEGFSSRQAKLVAEYINEMAVNGSLDSARGKLTLAQLYRVYHMTDARLSALYKKYIANKGKRIFRFCAFKKDVPEYETVKGPVESLALDVSTSSDTLTEADTYDVAAIRIKVRDNYGNIADYFDDSVNIHVTGDISLIGPDVVPVRGGMAGCYVRSLGVSGTGSVDIAIPQLDSVTLDFKVLAAKKAL